MRELIINHEYRIESKLGSGSYGVVYAGTNTRTEEKVAIKLQKIDPVEFGMANEIEIFEQLRINHGNAPPPTDDDNNTNDPRPVPRKTIPEGFGKLHYWGIEDDYEVMVLDLLGPDIETLWKYAVRVDAQGNLPAEGLTPKTISMIGTQAILRLRTLHKEGVLHMDIKPENLLMGRGKKSNVLYLADFGVSVLANGGRTFLHRQANEHLHAHENPVNLSPFVGTDYYASLNVHRYGGYTYADDLESLLYTLLQLRMNKLPWSGLGGLVPAPNDSVAIGAMKADLTPAEICAGAEPEFAAFLTHVRAVRPGQMPNYARLTKLMQNLVIREGVRNDKVYDWTKTRHEKLRTLMEGDMDVDG